MTYLFAPFGGGSRVVILWDMLRFYADRFVKVINGLHLVEVMMAQPESFLKNEGLVTFYADEVKQLHGHLEELNLAVSSKKALLLYLVLTSSSNDSPAAAGQVIKQYSEDLRERIADELEGKTFLHVSDRAGMLSDPLPFGGAVDKAFPSAQYDILEAGRCLVLKRSTACVVHLMRLLEVGLSSLATALDVNHTDENWKNILDRIQKEIGSRDKATHGEKWKNEDEPFFSGAASHFLLIKNAWRNHAMHGRDKYTEEQAEEIYGSVRSFMRHLSERLSEEGLSS